MQGDENIITVEWVDVDKAEELMPYHPNGIRSFLKKTYGAQYVMQE